jgi:hypothetical protein
LLGTTVVNHTLYIEEKGCWLKSGNPVITLRLPDVRYVDVRAANAQIFVERFELEHLEIQQQATGKLVLDVQTRSLKLQLASGSTCKATGKVGSANLNLANQVKLEARQLVAQTVRLSAHTNSLAEVYATDSLTIQSTGARVLYLGNPAYRSTVGSGIVQGTSNH